MKFSKIHTVVFYKAVRVNKETIESVSTLNQRYSNVNIEEYKDMGLKVSWGDEAVIVPFANVAFFAGDKGEEPTVKATKVK